MRRSIDLLDPPWPHPGCLRTFDAMMQRAQLVELVAGVSKPVIRYPLQNTCLFVAK